ncbi:PREDICTED: uncharacterized protein LOC109464950 [Branchiostoma belcheri]|uniref:Uncharacterized protein LOC109464950 n=1 Tax=Branchiostoma belcheri TaxID=7741 RepID=A0A6P4YFS0_BRABE|nr:PREDICTED: uncharacterized protein LOC109464950 [Branchiostoma belcheri]
MTVRSNLMLRLWLVRCWLLFACLCPMFAATSAQPCAAGCTCFGPMMVCNAAGLRDVPRNIPATTTHLYLKNNRISIIYRAAFSDVPNLSVLHLGNNFLTNPFIQEGCFDNLAKLETIVLSDNRLTAFPYRKLRGLQSKLQNLDLSGNLIRRIEPGALSQFKNLRELLLARTGLSDISPDTFIGPALLRTLNLDYNNLSVVPTEALKQLGELRKLSLRGNPISEVAIDGLSVLKYLDLGEMQLTELGEDAFQAMPYLVVLLLDGNRLLSRVDPAAFLSLTRLKYLTLHGCGLAALPPTTLDTMWSLQSISLAGNPFRCDAELCGLVWWLQDTEVELTNRDDITCNTPDALAGRHLNVTIAEGVCQPEPEILPPEPEILPPEPEAEETGNELTEETLDPPPIDAETDDVDDRGDDVDDRGDDVDDRTDDVYDRTDDVYDRTDDVDDRDGNVAGTDKLQVENEEKETTDKGTAGHTDSPISNKEEQHHVDENKEKQTTNSVVDHTTSPVVIPEKEKDDDIIEGKKTTTEPGTKVDVDAPKGEEKESRESTNTVDNNTEDPLPEPSINLTERQELKAPESGDRKAESETTAAPTEPARTPRKKKVKAKFETTPSYVEGTDWPEERTAYDDCPAGCRCRRWYVNCSDSELTAVPRNLPASTRYLYLYRNKITSLPPGALGYLSELRLLDLTSNLLTNDGLTSGSFKTLTKLDALYLSTNRLRSFPKEELPAFRPLTNLRTLLLSGSSRLVRLKKKSLLGLTNLRYLDVTNSALRDVHPGVFRDTKSLYRVALADNPFVCSAAICPMVDWINEKLPNTDFMNIERATCAEPDFLRGKSLLTLQGALGLPCRRSRPANIEESRSVAIALVECPISCACQGQAVDCKNRGLREILTTFPYQTRSLDLGNNMIGSIPPGTFVNLPNLERLNLENNELAHDSLVSGSFYGLGQLKHLNLSYNKFSVFPEETQSLGETLEVLDLSGNKISRIRPETFADFENLKVLYMRSTGLRRLERASLTGMDNLTSLHLDNNRLTIMPNKEIQSLRSLKNLTMRANPVKHISKKSLYHFPALEHLDIRDMRLKKLGKRIFHQIPSLKTLQLSGNVQLSSVHRTSLSTLKNLQHLELDNCNLTTLPREILDDLPSLSYCTLQSNPWKCKGPKFCGLYKWLVQGTVEVPFQDEIQCGSPASERWRPVRSVSISKICVSTDTKPTQVPELQPTTPVANDTLCPSNCSCRDDNSVYCSHAGLNTIPTPLPETTASLFLDHNNISVLNPSEFAGLPNLQVLDLTTNLLTFDSIDDTTFSALTKLRYLYLSKNRFTSIPMYVPSSTYYLDVQGNQITGVREDMLSELLRNVPSLNWIALENNPWHCDPDVCTLRKLLDSGAIRLPYPEKMLCSTPPNLKDLAVMGPYIQQFCESDEGFPSPDDANVTMTTPATTTAATDTGSGSTSARTKDCPSMCACTTEGYVNCANAGLTSPPAKLPVRTRHLNLAQNQIRYVGQDDLRDLPSLKVLELQGNGITDSGIQDGFFQRLSSLEYLFLSDNELTSVPEKLPPKLYYLELHANRVSGAVPSCTFWGLPHLQLLDLHGNTLKNEGLDQGSFLGIQNLTYIYLSNNLISSVPAHLPTTLLYLYLNHNHISMIPTGIFDRHGKLRRLYIERNLLRDSGIETNSFQGLRSLRFLSLAGNQLLFVPKNMPQSLTHLVLDDNKIDFLPPKCFQGLHRLQLLSLNNNSLPDHGIHSGSFAGLHKLTRLYLSNNSLKSVPYGLPKTLEDLNLDRNGIATLDRSKLKSLENLQKLSVAWNNVTLHGIPPKIFDDLREITHLDLDGNNIESVPEHLPGKLEILKLSNNLISMIPNNADMSHMGKLQWLVLGNNRLTSRYFPHQIFAHLGELKHLDLSHNYLEEVPPNLPRSLEFLYLNNNGIESIQEDTFMGLPFLKALDLSNNYLAEVRIAPGSLRRLSALRSLNLSENDFRKPLDKTELPYNLQEYNP